MGRVRSGLMATAIAGTIGAAAFVGCAADGGAPDVPLSDRAGTDPGNSVPASSGGRGGKAGSSDASAAAKGDAGSKSDASVDAGPTFPVPGEPCTKLNESVEKPCGICGKQSAVCLARDGGGHWSDYGSCEGEVAGGCQPGQTDSEPCGNCGTRVSTCTDKCAWKAGQCSGQPANSCAPGSLDLVAQGCPSNSYRQKACKADCSYDNLSDPCTPPASSVNVAPTVGAISSTIAILSKDQTMPRISGSCPSPMVSMTITPYVYIQVKNPLPRAATVSIWNSVAPNGVVFETILAAYPGEAGPTDDSARRSCIQMNLYGSVGLTGDNKFASLDGVPKIAVPPGGTISVYVAADKPYDPQNPRDSIGPVKLNVKTESIAP